MAEDKVLNFNGIVVDDGSVEVPIRNRQGDTIGGQVFLTTDPCTPDCGKPLACGCITSRLNPPCCPPDPRPLFGAPPRPLPGGSIFY